MADGATNAAERIGPDRARRNTQFWRAPLDFAVHGLVGSAIFAIIAVPAVILDLSVHRLGTLATSLGVILGLQVAEYAILTTDLFLFGVFLWRTAKRTIEHL